jgi:hypothetical protein
MIPERIRTKMMGMSGFGVVPKVRLRLVVEERAVCKVKGGRRHYFEEVV